MKRDEGPARGGATVDSREPMRLAGSGPGKIDRASLRLSSVLLLGGQILYIVITLFHTGGDANDHPAIFTAYAKSGLWVADHVGQFAAMALVTGGLVAMFYALDARDGTARWAGRFGAAAAVSALGLYGALQAVDGVANKMADAAWVTSGDAERAARFASAETVRWMEWGMRSYHAYLLGVALVMFAVAVLRTRPVPRPIAYLMGVAGFTYLAQGWVVGTEGFSPTMSSAIALAEVLNVVWMVWLVVAAWRMKAPIALPPAGEGPGPSTATPGLLVDARAPYGSSP